MIADRDCKISVLSERYHREIPDGLIEFDTYVAELAEGDPGFFRWLFGDPELGDFEVGKHWGDWQEFLEYVRD